MAQNKGRQDCPTKPGIKEVAAVAGVSPTTVSRVLNNRGYISQETRDRVHEAMRKVNYAPNDIARAMLKGHTNLIGLVVPSTTSPFHAQVAEVVERTLAEEGFKMLLCNGGNRPDRELFYIDMLRRNMVDGVIVSSLNVQAEVYSEAGLAMVGIDCDLGPNAVQIASDNYHLGELATNRLIADGCRSILCLRNNSRMRMPGNKRSDAYRDVMLKHGLVPMFYEIAFMRPSEEKEAAVAQILASNPHIDGIFAGDDGMAAICVRVIRSRGMSVPEDIKVIGADASRVARLFFPELTTVGQDIDAIGELAAQAVMALVRGESVQSNTAVPVRLIEGQTA